MLLIPPVVLDEVVSFCEAISIIQWPATIHAGCPCSSFWMLEIIPHLWFAIISCIMLIISPPPLLMSIDISGVVVVFPPLCAITGVAIPKIPLPIAKVASATTAALRIVFIKQRGNNIDLKDPRENSLISFAARYTPLLDENLGFLSFFY